MSNEPTPGRMDTCRFCPGWKELGAWQAYSVAKMGLIRASRAHGSQLKGLIKINETFFNVLATLFDEAQITPDFHHT